MNRKYEVRSAKYEVGGNKLQSIDYPLEARMAIRVRGVLQNAQLGR